MKKLLNLFVLITLFLLSACELPTNGNSLPTPPASQGESDLTDKGLLRSPIRKPGGIPFEMENLSYSAGSSKVLDYVVDSGDLAVATTYTPLLTNDRYLAIYYGNTILVSEQYFSEKPVNYAGIAKSLAANRYWVATAYAGEDTGVIKLSGVFPVAPEETAVAAATPAATATEDFLKKEHLIPAQYVGRFYGGITKGFTNNDLRQSFFIIVPPSNQAAAAVFKNNKWEFIANLGFSVADLNYMQIVTRPQTIYILLQRNNGKIEVVKGNNDFTGWQTLTTISGMVGGKAHMDIHNIGGGSEKNQVIGIAYPLSNQQVALVELGEQAFYTSPTVIHNGRVGTTAYPIYSGDAKYVSVLWMSMSGNISNVYPAAAKAILSISTVNRAARLVAPPRDAPAATYFLGEFRRPLLDFSFIRRASSPDTDTLIVQFYQKTKKITASSLYYQVVGIDGYYVELETGLIKKDGTPPVPGSTPESEIIQPVEWGGL